MLWHEDLTISIKTGSGRSLVARLHHKSLLPATWKCSTVNVFLRSSYIPTLLTLSLALGRVRHLEVGTILGRCGILRKLFGLFHVAEAERARKRCDDRSTGAI